jgi:DNA modification methylase
MAEVARVLVPTGSVWLNLGDSYSRHSKYGAPPKSLFMAPERLALALIEDGWILRNRVTYHKSNPMPASVTDRLTTTSDVIFFLTRSPRYHFDLDRIREPQTSTTATSHRSRSNQRPDWQGPHGGANDGLGRDRPGGLPGNVVGRNPGDVWRMASGHYRGAHFATFPEALIRRPLLATCPVKVCTACGQPWKSGPGKTFVLGKRIPAGRDRYVRRYPGRWQVLRQPGPLEPDCSCDATTRPGLVLDPFMGSGTVAVTAEKLGLDWLGVELNPDYVVLAWQRLGRAAPPSHEQAA